MIQIIIAQILWMLLASLDGFIQAHYYALFPSEKKHRDLHNFYVLQRGILLFVLCYGLWWNITGVECLIFSVACGFTYSFFHNGFYYLTRNNLDKEVYPKRFWDDTDSSDAFFNISAKFRTAMAIIGLLFIVGLILQQYDKV